MNTNFLFSLTNKHNDENASYANAVKDKMLFPTTNVWRELISAVVFNGEGGDGQC